MKKRILSILLLCCMVLTLLPTTVLAADGPMDTIPKYDVSIDVYNRTSDISIKDSRGSFYVTAMSREQMEAVGYGVHHISDDGKYLIMGNGTRAFAVAAEQPEKDNPLRTAEMTLEDDYGMIDGVINNGRRGEELEKAKEHAERTQPEKKPSIRERLAAAKQECAKQQPRPAPEKKPPELGEL